MGSRRLKGMGPGTLAVGLAVTAALALPQAASARAPLACTWAGTPAAPTGSFTITPGLTNLPSSGPLRFHASGRLAGGKGCHGTMTFDGQLDRGATCPDSTFEGRVYGLPGVARFVGNGSLDVPSLLFDKRGDLVGVENAEIATQTTFAHTLDCSSPQGFSGGWPAMFSSVVERFTRGR